MICQMSARVAAIVLTVAAAASCHPAISGHIVASPPLIQPGAPGAPSHAIAADQSVDLSKVQHSAADVQFMQGMIHHHAQALDMTALVGMRTASEDMRKLALRIELSQADEIKMMQRWLEVRGQEAPSEHAHHMPGAPLMPGMLTPEEMDVLASAKGVHFDQLFLEFMIKHHAGALIMVDELFSAAGAGQESEVFAFASDVVADQKAEIERMGSMLQEFEK
jgi:uncharacterized protein (DUF305 family)